MQLSRARLILSIAIAAAIVFSGCQAAAPAPTPAPAAPPKAAEKAPAPAPAKKAEPAATAKPTAAPAAPAKPTAAPAAAAKPAAKPAAAKPAVPTNLSKPTMEFLAKVKKDASFLAGIDDELKVPQAWIDGAKKEGKLAVIHTMNPPQAEVFLQPFKARYPFIQVDWQRGSDEEKAKAIVAAQAGRATVDILFGVGSKVPVLTKNNLTRDTSDAPAWKFVPEGIRSPEGTWVGQSSRYWAMAYNTNKVKKEELPKTWEEVLTSPAFRGGKLGVMDEPEQWLLPLWGVKGEKWAKDFATKLFSEVKPQLRKEDLNAGVELLAAGEYNFSLPSAGYRVIKLVAKGAPVAWFTPEPAPISASAMVSLKAGVNPNAAKIFVNWYISKEGQLSQFVASGESPMRPELQANELMVFPEAVIGKKIAPQNAKLTADHGDALEKFWSDLWLKGGGVKKK